VYELCQEQVQPLDRQLSEALYLFLPHCFTLFLCPLSIKKDLLFGEVVNKQLKNKYAEYAFFIHTTCGMST
jgi:hypothetical protein